MIAPLLVALALVQAPLTATDQPWPPAGVARMGAGIKAPEIVKERKPGYTAAAMDAKIQGSVILEAVVLTNGRVGEVRVKQSLDREYGLDAEAIAALKKWEFKPGMKDGVIVPVVVEVELTFTLRK